MTVRIMSDKELARLEVLRDLDHQRLTTRPRLTFSACVAARCCGC